MRLLLSIPANNERGPLFMDQVFAALHQAIAQPITLFVEQQQGEVVLALEFPDEARAAVEGQLYSHFPEARLEPITPPASEETRETWSAELRLKSDLYPLRCYPQFEDSLTRRFADPLAATMTAIASTPKGMAAQVAIQIRPASHLRVHLHESCVRMLARPFLAHHHIIAAMYRDCHLSYFTFWRWIAWLWAWFIHESHVPSPHLTTSNSRQHERENDLSAANEKSGKLLFETTISIIVAGNNENEPLACTKIREIAGTFGQFNSPRRARFRLSPIRIRETKADRRSFLLATDELATLWHPATVAVQAPTMAIVESREAEPPVRLPTTREHSDLAVLGQAVFRNNRHLCGLLPDDRRRHLLIEGKTGQGKSTLLHRLLLNDIANGHGVALIDPHGDLCDAVVAAVPSRRTNDVVFFDVADTSHPLAFNVLACPDPGQRALTASGIIAGFKKIWGEFFGPRMEHILRNTLLTLLEVPGTTLISVVQLLGDADFRNSIVGRISDPLLRSFWTREFASMPPKFQAEAIAPIYNKVGQLVSNPLLRNILGQSRSTIQLREIMDEGRILLVNLSKGRAGEDASALLGAFLVTAMQQAAMSRANVPELERRDFHLYIDEFQNFATESFATILSEARKYRLSLTVANQYLDQIDDTTRAAVFGNIGSMIVFQVGVQDAELLAEQLGGNLTPRDLMALPRFQAYARFLIEGQPSRPFTFRTLPPQPHSPRHEQRTHAVRRYCRQRYGRPVAKVQQEIASAFAS